MDTVVILLTAIVSDMLLGDPGGNYHPVALIGRLISFTETLLYKEKTSIGSKFLRGMLSAILVLICTFFVGLLITLAGNSLIHQIFQGVVLSFLISTKTLVIRGMEIANDLKANKLVEARKKLSFIVSRETTNLHKEDIVRGTVETMAENFVDGLVAPLFWFAIFGLPGAFVYRTANTLDAMFGYRNERYEYFGKFSARLDDVLNFIPSRIGGIILLLAGALLGYKPIEALRIWKRDAAQHPSPNSGIPEAVVAGLLNVRLGGYNFYSGRKHFRAYLGDALKEFKTENIIQLRNLLYTSTFVYGAVLSIILGLTS